jgi:DNA polymerase III sliding clamp (beta) subunit (PCNA family)
MHIKVNPTAIADALAKVVPFTTKRVVLPVLQAVKVEAGDATLTLSATDMDSAIRYIVSGVETLREGVAVIPARPFQQLLRNLDEFDEVELDAPTPDGGYGKATLKFPNGVYRLDAYDPADYPPMDFKVEGDGVSVSVIGSDLAQALKFASTFAGAQSYWQATDLVWLTLRDEELWVAGTDTHKLGLVRLPAPDPEGNLKAQIYLPVASASALATLCETNPNIVLRFNAQTLIAEGGRWQVRINGREASHLNFDHVLSRPTERATTLMFSSVVPVLQFLQRVTPFDRRRHSRSVMPAAGMRIKVTATEQGLELEAVVKETYGADEEIVGRIQLPIEDFKGEPTVIWFNRRLLAETLQAFKPFKVQLGLETPTPTDLKPLIVTVLETDPLTIVAYLMPLRFAPTETADADSDNLEGNGDDWDDADDANLNM